MINLNKLIKVQQDIQSDTMSDLYKPNIRQ